MDQVRVTGAIIIDTEFAVDVAQELKSRQFRIEYESNPILTFVQM